MKLNQLIIGIFLLSVAAPLTMGMGLEVLRGLKLLKVNKVDTVTVKWKQGSMLGVGGSKSQTYDLYTYKNANNPDSKVPVYVQTGWEAPDTLIVDDRLQAGYNIGEYFFVLHDKSQKPYQHRFVMKNTQKLLYKLNDLLKLVPNTNGILDASWIAGDYLHNI